jgi:hypothetical protein
MKALKISSHRFRWDNSARACGVSITVLFDMDKESIIRPVLGYCNSSSVEIAPKVDCYAVMFDYEEEEIWIHIPKDSFNRWLNKKD